MAFAYRAWAWAWAGFGLSWPGLAWHAGRASNGINTLTHTREANTKQPAKTRALLAALEMEIEPNAWFSAFAACKKVPSMRH